MADLEKLALKRDRGYLLRMVLAAVIALVLAFTTSNALTDGRVGGCLADAYLGRGDGPEGEGAVETPAK